MEKQGQRYKRIVGLLAGSALIGLTPSVWASGFQTSELAGASTMGTAYAGAVSLAEDASTGFYNSAGLTRLNQEQLVFANTFVNVSTTLYPTSASPTLGAGAVNGNSWKASNTIVSPALHYAKRIDEKWVASFNYSSPFAARSNYKNDSIGRYMGTKSQIRTANIGPSLAYGFDNGCSVGGGIDAMYLSARLDARVGTGNLAADGYQENTLNSWALGYHFGLLHEFSDETRVGAQYRSKVKQKGRGHVLAQQSAVLPLTRQGVRGDITLPETIGVSAFHILNDYWAVMSDVTWTHWNRFKQIRLVSDNGNTTTISAFYRNSYKVALGAHYKLNETWKLKFGTAFDKTPVRDAYRSVRIPDNNRYIAAIGVQRQVSKNLKFDFGYSHVFFNKAAVNDNGPILTPTQTTQRFTGSSKTKIDLVGIQLTWDLV